MSVALLAASLFRFVVGWAGTVPISGVLPCSTFS